MPDRNLTLTFDVNNINSIRCILVLIKITTIFSALLPHPKEQSPDKSYYLVLIHLFSANKKVYFLISKKLF